MAVTVGSEYDHVEVVNGSNTVKHYLKDAAARESVESIDDRVTTLEAHFPATNRFQIVSGKATANYAFSEGTGTASGTNSHAEGVNTTASGNNSHAEGSATQASYTNAHAEGMSTIASGTASHAEGAGTVANHMCQHVFGANNIPDPSTASAGTKGTYIEIVGNSMQSNVKSNARTLDWSGNEALAGSLTLGKGTANEATITAAQLRQLLALLS